MHEAEPDRHLGIFPMPQVVRLVQYVVTKWRCSAGPGWSRPGILARDGRVCGYCSRTATTVDHIMPTSRGERNTWTNTGAACDGCNQRKGDRTPAEAGMVLRVKPTAPTWTSVALR